MEKGLCMFSSLSVSLCLSHSLSPSPSICFSLIFFSPPISLVLSEPLCVSLFVSSCSSLCLSLSLGLSLSLSLPPTPMNDSCQRTGFHSNPTHHSSQRKLPGPCITGEQCNSPGRWERALLPHMGEAGPDWPLTLGLGRFQPGFQPIPGSPDSWSLAHACFYSFIRH